MIGKVQDAKKRNLGFSPLASGLSPILMRLSILPKVDDDTSSHNKSRKGV